MKNCDIMESFVTAIEETIFKQWRHEGFIGGWSSDYVDFVIDGKEYVLKLREVADGEHWSQKDGE